MNEKMSKRELVELEILTSEKSYSRDISIFLDVFIRPLQRHARSQGRNACLTDVEASVLECSLGKVSQCSKELLRQLEHERSGAKDTKSMGKIFMDESERVRKAYVDFISGYRSALDLHTDLLAREKKKGASISYHSFIRNCAHSHVELVGGRNFADFFILPIQRVPRYRLLLQQLLKRVSSRYERAFLKEGIRRISIVADEMNYRLRKTADAKVPRFAPRQQSSHSSKDEGEVEEQLDTITEETEDDTVSSAGEEEDDGVLALEHQELVERENKERLAITSCVLKEAKVDLWLEYRQWKGENLMSGPTGNSFALFALAMKGNPWKASELASLNAAQLSNRLHGLYFQWKNPVHEYKPIKGDVIVIGPLRSGQTPVLHALDCFSSETIARGNSHSILDHVGFLNSDDYESVPSFRYRILKSHNELKTAFGGIIAPAMRGSRPEWRVVATLRHPADLRISYFRHLRRMFRKLNPSLNFDRMAVLEEFYAAMIEYEQFVADVLKVAVEIKSPQLHIVFYEEMITDPLDVVRKLASFVEYKPSPDAIIMKNGKESERDAFIRAVTASITSSPFYVGYSSRVGSTNQGRARFSKTALARMDADWEQKIKSKFKFESYESMFCHFVEKEEYPYDPTEDGAKVTTFSATPSEGSQSRRGSGLHKSMSFTFMFRAKRNSVVSVKEKEKEKDVIPEPEVLSPSHSNGEGSGGRGSFISRFQTALSFSSNASSDREGSSGYLEDGGHHGTSRDKTIDPDDSDEEISDELMDYWTHGSAAS